LRPVEIATASTSSFLFTSAPSADARIWFDWAAV
jgi:hypothetical protein